MNIYHYDPCTAAFIGAGSADESPLEAGTFLIPAHATATAPPTFNLATHSCCWIGGEWLVVAVPVPEIPLPATVEELRAVKLADLAAERFARETGGITVNGAVIRTDRESQATLTGAWVRVQQLPEALIDWKGANGWAQLNQTAVEAICGAVGSHVQACFSREKAHADAIVALVTIEEIDAYDITTGWLAAV